MPAEIDARTPAGAIVDKTVEPVGPRILDSRHDRELINRIHAEAKESVLGRQK